MEEEGTTINLSSYEIAGIMYHADLAALRSGYVYELAILAETQRHFDALYKDKTKAAQLVAPDGSRKLLDDESKMGGLLQLSCALDSLLKEVAKEQSLAIRVQATPSTSDSRDAIRSLVF